MMLKIHENRLHRQSFSPSRLVSEEWDRTEHSDFLPEHFYQYLYETLAI